MSLLDELGGALRQYADGGVAPQQDAVQNYQQIAPKAPPSLLSGALNSIFLSPQTGTFGQNVASMFERSDPGQRAGFLNMLLASGVGGELLPKLGLEPGTNEVTPQQAQQIPSASVQAAAEHAQQRDPSIVDRASEFYSHHPALVGALGGVAATMALQHLARH